jgi:hypothetical protein
VQEIGRPHYIILCRKGIPKMFVYSDRLCIYVASDNSEYGTLEDLLLAIYCETLPSNQWSPGGYVDILIGNDLVVITHLYNMMPYAG